MSSGIETSQFSLAAAWARFDVLRQKGFLSEKSERHQEHPLKLRKLHASVMVRAHLSMEG